MLPPKHPRILSLLTISLALNCFLGCASYRLGDATTAPFRTIYIVPTLNESYAPLAAARVSAEIRESFIRDGRVTLTGNEAEADVVLSVTLTDYRRTAQTRDQNDTVRARDFNVALAAKLSLYSPGQGNYYFRDRTVYSNTSAYVGNPYGANGTTNFDYRQAENLAMNRLARDLAKGTLSAVLGNW